MTPRAAVRTRIATAAMFWSMAGLFLLGKATAIIQQEPWGTILLMFPGAAAVGAFKSRLVFDPTARAIITHIRHKPEPACLGGMFSLRNWAVIVVMVLLGRGIGASPLPAALRAGILCMVGTGLLYSSRLMWRAWRATPAILLQDLRAPDTARTPQDGRPAATNQNPHGPQHGHRPHTPQGSPDPGPHGQ